MLVAMLAMVPMVGPNIPAVAHVGVVPGAGGSGYRHLRQGPWGSIGPHMP